MKSTSFSPINGDRFASRLVAPLYFLINNAVNRRFADGDGLDIRTFRTSEIPFPSISLPETASPARVLSHLFWMALAWTELERELGALYVLDTGCGSGRYRALFERWSGARIAGYTGIDSHPRPAAWDRIAAAHPGSRFMAVSAEQVASVLTRDVNLIVSQSALEHVKGDRTYFESLADFARAPARPTVQVHLLHAPACLGLYGLHGFRQYPPGVMRRITGLFEDFSRAYAFALGGARCKEVHRRFIHNRAGGDRRATETETYGKCLLDALRADMESPADDPLFYALVIQLSSPPPGHQGMMRIRRRSPKSRKSISSESTTSRQPALRNLLRLYRWSKSWL